MCGIVGLLLKDASLRPRLGELMVPMLIGMTERGPDSSGMAVFADAVAGDRHKLSLYCAQPGFDWRQLEGAWIAQLGAAQFELNANHCIVTTAADVTRVAAADVHPDQLIIVAAGDRAKIEPQLKAADLGPVEVRDINGKLVTDAK